MKRYFWGLLLLTFVFAGQVDSIRVYSAAMDSAMPAIVVTPDENGGQSAFPVVYLLHGYSGNYRNWSDKTDLAAASDRFQVIIICPEGGYDSWYLDSPVNPKSQYESWIIRDLIPWIDAHYRTNASRDYRAITGLSMGGHGALYLAIRHPDLFSAAGSMSGVMDLSFSSNRYGIVDKLGPIEKYPDRWKNNSIVGMVDQIKPDLLHLFIDCGVDDRFIGLNRTLHEALLSREIPHEYIERPGGHSWDFWTHALDYHLLFFRQHFDVVSPR